MFYCISFGVFVITTFRFFIITSFLGPQVRQMLFKHHIELRHAHKMNCVVVAKDILPNVQGHRFLPVFHYALCPSLQYSAILGL